MRQMNIFDLHLSTSVTASSQGDSIVITANNLSGGKLRVQFPNPYTGIRLYKKSGEMVRIGRTLLCWEENDPNIEISPGSSVSALVLLSPFWFDLHGTFIAKCTLRVGICNGENETGVVEGHVNLDLAPFDRNRPRPVLPGPEFKFTIGNVSRFVSIIQDQQKMS